jgi:hypothetical protein
MGRHNLGTLLIAVSSSHILTSRRELFGYVSVLLIIFHRLLALPLLVFIQCLLNFSIDPLDLRSKCVSPPKKPFDTGFAAVPPNDCESSIYFDRTVTINYYLLGGNR